MSRIRTSMAVVVLGAVWVFAVPARAQETRVRLQFRAEGPFCLDEETFARNVSGRLGHSPFSGDAPWVLSVEVRPDGDRLRARAVLQRPDASIAGVRELDAGLHECVALIESLSFATTLWLEEAFASTPSEQEPDTPDPPTSAVAVAEPDFERPPALVPRAAPSAVAEASGLEWQAALATLATVGFVPGVGFGARLDGGIITGSFELMAEARLDSSAGYATSSGHELSARQIGAGVVGCVSDPMFRLCVPILVGSYSVDARTVVTPNTQTAIVPLLGARVGFRWRASTKVALLAEAEALAPLRSLDLEIDGRPVYSTWPIVVGASLGVEVRP